MEDIFENNVCPMEDIFESNVCPMEDILHPQYLMSCSKVNGRS